MFSVFEKRQPQNKGGKKYNFCERKNKAKRLVLHHWPEYCLSVSLELPLFSWNNSRIKKAMRFMFLKGRIIPGLGESILCVWKLPSYEIIVSSNICTSSPGFFWCVFLVTLTLYFDRMINDFGLFLCELFSFITWSNASPNSQLVCFLCVRRRTNVHAELTFEIRDTRPFQWSTNKEMYSHRAWVKLECLES